MLLEAADEPVVAGAAPLASTLHRGHAWLPPRSMSQPALTEQRSQSSERGDIASGACPAGASGTTTPAMAPPTTPAMMSAIQRRAKHVRAIELDAGILPERSAKSAEHYRDECLKLKAELANRREETRQLQHRVRLLEGPLQAHMQELEALMEDLRGTVAEASASAAGVGLSNGSAAAGGVMQSVVVGSGSAEGRHCRLADLLEKIVHEARRTQVVLQSHVDSGAQLEAKDRLLAQAQSDREAQGVLRDQLLETQRENRRLASKIRSSDQSSMRQKLDQARRSVKKHEQVVMEYERSHHDLHDRTQHLSDQLQEERKERRKHERNAKWLAIELEEALAQLWRQQQELQQPQLQQQLGGETREPPDVAQAGQLVAEMPLAHQATDDVTILPGASPSACSSDAPGHAGGARALRQELLALREEERALRRLQRRRCSKERSEAGIGDVDAVEDSVRSSGSREAAACAALREAFRAAGQREQALREELRAAERRIAALEEGRTSELKPPDTRASVVEMAQMEDALEEEVRLAECRTWFLAEVANEIALRADLRQLSALETQVEWQQCVRSSQRREELAELRCASMAAVVNDIAGALAVDPGKLRA